MPVETAAKITEWTVIGISIAWTWLLLSAIAIGPGGPVPDGA